MERLMPSTTIKREPAVLPLYAAEVMIHVRALRNKGSIKKGSDYVIGIIRKDGKVHLVSATPGEWYDMDLFVELIHPKAANDNG